MSNSTHVHGWPQPRSPLVPAAGAVLVSSVLISGVLLLFGAVPASGAARMSAQGPSTGAANHARTDHPTDPDASTTPGWSGRVHSTWPAPKSSWHRMVTTKTDPPTTAPSSEPSTRPSHAPSPTRSPRPDPQPTPARTKVDPSADPSGAPAGPRARLAAGPPQPATTAPQPSSPFGGSTPDRVPDVGIQPSVATAPSPVALSATDLAVDGPSFLPAKEMGVKIFSAGLVALVVSIGGLVTLALRRRQ
jgi:hypothetical protein